MLTDAAKFVLAGEGRWNAAAIVSGALAATRGELRRRLGEIRARGPASRDGASLLWVDAYRPAAASDVVGDVVGAAVGDSDVGDAVGVLVISLQTCSMR